MAHVVGFGAAVDDVLARVHRLGDRLHLVGDVVRHADVVVGKIERHAQERPAETILVGRIEIEMVGVGRVADPCELKQKLRR